MAIKLSGSVIIDDSRNIIGVSSVGIGTTNPVADLDVRGSATVNANIASVAVSTSFYVGGEVTNSQALHITPDGHNVFVSDGNDVTRYRLTEAWNVGAGNTYLGEVRYDTIPTWSAGTEYGMTFSPDGQKLYIVIDTNDEVRQINLSTPYDLRGVNVGSSYTAFSVTSEETDPRTVEFKPDGTKMYVSGATNDTIFQYTLSTPWDVTTASYDSVSSSLRYPGGSGSSTVPRACRFTADGTLLVFLEAYDDTIAYYRLTTPWDVSTLEFVEELIDLTGTIDAPQDLVIKPDLSQIYVVGSTSDRVWSLDVTRTDSSNLSVIGELNATDLKVNQDITAYGGVKSYGQSTLYGNVGIGTESVNDFALTVQGQSDIQNISRANQLNQSYVENSYSYYTGNEASNPAAVGFNTVGDKLYVLPTNDTIYEYDLSTSWRVGTASYTGNSVSLNADDATMVDFVFKPDGSKLFAIGQTNDKIYEYALSTPWTLSTASLTTTRDTPSNIPASLDISPDGTKALFVGGTNYHGLFEYTFGTPWDLDTLVGPSTSAYVGREEATATGVQLSSDGTKMYIVGSSGDAIVEYSLSTAFDLTTATATGNEQATGDTTPYALYLRPDGTQIFTGADSSNLVRTWNLSTPFDLSTATAGNTFNVNAEETVIQGLFFKDDGTEMYVIGNSYQIHQYNLSSAWDVATATFTDERAFTNFGLSGNILHSFSRNDVGFSTTGDRLYTLDIYNNLHQFELDTPWEINSVSIASTSGITTSYSFTDLPYPNYTQGFDFSDDGLMLFVVNYGNDIVSRYNLSTAWDINTITSDQSSINYFTLTGTGDQSLNSNVTALAAAKYNQDGTKIYALGGTNPYIYEYNLSTPYDIRTAVSSGEYLPYAPQESNVTSGTGGIFIGDKNNTLYLTGQLTDRVWEYDIDGITGISKAKSLDDSLRFFDINTTSYLNNGAEAITFAPNGKYMYVAEHASGACLQFELSTPWDIRYAKIIGYYDFNTSDPEWVTDINLANIRGIDFSIDGKYVYVVDSGADEVFQFEVSVPWNISTIYGFVGAYSVYDEDTNPEGVRFGKNGYKMYILGNSGNDINEYTLTKAWDIKTASFTNRFPLRDTDPHGFHFSKDGNRIFVVGQANDYINEYKLETAWDITTAFFIDRYRLSAEGFLGLTDIYVTGDRKHYYVSDSSFGVKRFRIPTNDISVGSDLKVTGGVEVFQESHFRGTLNANEVKTENVEIGDVTSSNSSYGIISSKRVDFAALAKSGNKLSDAINVPSVSKNLGSINEKNTTNHYAFHIDSTGTNVYYVSSDDTLSQGKLSTPWDVSTLSHVSNIWLEPIGTYGGAAVNSLDMDPDEQYLYMTFGSYSSNNEYNYMLQYDITDKNIQTISLKNKVNLAGALSTEDGVSLNNTSVRGHRFKDDGTKLFLDVYASASENFIHEFSLDTAWDISTLSNTASKIFNIGQIGSRYYNVLTLYHGFQFNDDGTKIYTLNGLSGDNFRLVEFNLTTAWDIDTLNWSGNHYRLDGYNSVSYGLQIVNGGKKIITIGHQQQRLIQWDIEEPWNLYTIKRGEGIAYHPQLGTSNRGKWNITPNGEYLVTYTGDVFALTEPWNINSINDYPSFKFDYGFNLSLYDITSNIHGLKFNPEGNKMYAVATAGYNGSYVSRVSAQTRIIEYVMDAPYDFKTLRVNYTYKNAGYSNNEINPTVGDLDISSDGKYIFILDVDNERIQKYELTTPWDLSTIRGIETLLTISYEDAAPYGFEFSSDGRAVFVTGNVNAYQYTLKEPYDLRDAEFSGIQTAFTGTSQRGITLNNDGTKIYNVETNSDIIYERDLTTANDIRHGTDANSFSVSIETGVHGLSFNSDGTSMYVIGNTNDTVYQYGLTTAFNVASAGFTTSFNVNADTDYPFASQETQCWDVVIGNDGYSMYVLGQTNDVVYQYDLSIKDNVSSATYSKYFYAGALDVSPSGIRFNPEGTRMFVLGYNKDVLWQLELSTPWDVTTATYYTNAKQIGLDNLSSNHKDPVYLSNVYATEFSADGYGLYVFYYNSNNNQSWIVKWECAERWSPITAVITDTFKISDYVDGPRNFILTKDEDGIIVSDDTEVQLTEIKFDWEKNIITGGLEVYGKSKFNNAIDVEGRSTFANLGIGTTSSLYDDLTVAGNANLPYISANGNNIGDAYSDAQSVNVNYPVFGRFDATVIWRDVAFNDDGRYMYVANRGNDGYEGVIHQWKLDIPWDLTTAHPYDGLQFREGSTSFGNGQVESIGFSTGGHYFYVINDQGTGYEGVYQYTLSTPWELNTAGFTTSFQTTTEDNTPKSVGFSTGGDTMYLLGDQNDKIYQYSLSTDWDVSTATLSKETGTNAAADINVPSVIRIKSDGKKLWTVESGDSSTFGEIAPYNTGVYEWEFATPWDISTIKYTGKFLNLEPFVSTYNLTGKASVYFSTYGDYLFVFDQTTQYVNRFDLSTPWDISTAKLTNIDNRKITDSEDNFVSNIYGFDFSADGTKLTYTNSNNVLYQADLSTPWDFESYTNLTRVYTNNNFAVYNADSLKWKYDGTKLYVLSGATAHQDIIHEFDASVPWDIKSLSKVGSFDYGNFSQYADVGTTLDISKDGRKLYIGGSYYILEFDFKEPWSINTLKFAGDCVQLNNREFNSTNPDTFGITFRPNGLRYYYSVQNNTNPSYKIVQRNMSGKAWDVVDYEYAGEYQVDYIPCGLTFKSDGLKLYVADETNHQVKEYVLGTPWDVTSITSSTSFDTHRPGTSTDYDPRDVKFKSDGTKMYIAGRDTGYLYQYSLSSAWDISTATHEKLLNTRYTPASTRYQDWGPLAEYNPTVFDFSTDGKILYLGGEYNDNILQYELQTAWDVSTALAFDGNTTKFLRIDDNFDADDNLNGIYYKDDSTVFITTESTLDRLWKLEMSRVNDITSARVINRGYIDIYNDYDTVLGSLVNAISLSADGRYLYAQLTGSTYQQGVHEFELSSPYKLHGARITANEFVNYPNEFGESSTFNGMRLIKGDTELAFSIESYIFKYKIPHEKTTITGEIDLNGEVSVNGRLRSNLLEADTSNLRKVSIGRSGYPEQESLVVHGSADIRKISNKNKLSPETISRDHEVYSVAPIDNTAQSSVYSPTGDKVIMLGNQYDALYEFELSTPFDIRTAKYTWRQTDDLTELSTPSGLFVNDEGTKFYITDEATNYVYQYDATDPWNILSIGFTTSFDASTQDTDISAVHITGAGTTMYLVGYSADSVYQYTLSTPWNVSTASLTTSFGVSSDDNTPVGLTFNNDNSEMYVLGQQNDKIYQYTLSTPADVSTASLTTSISTPSQFSTTPDDIFMSSDGNKLLLTWNANLNGFGAIGLSTAYNLSSAQNVQGWLDVYETGSDDNTNSNKFYIRPDGLKLYVIEYNDADQDIHEYTLTTPWEIGTATFDQAHDLGDNYYGIEFKPDGTKMYLTNYDASYTTSSIHEYTLSSPWNIGTKTLTHNFIVGTFDTGLDINDPSSIRIAADGKRFYVLNETDYYLYPYEMETPWDLSTAREVSKDWYINAIDNDPRGVSWNNDGTKVYFGGNQNDKVYQLEIPSSRAYDIRYATNAGISTTVTDTAITGLTFKPDGTKMYVVGSTNDRVAQYDLSTAWDIETHSGVSTYFQTTSTLPSEVRFNPDGEWMYVLDNPNDSVIQYKLSTPWEISTAERHSEVYINDIMNNNSNDYTLEFGRDGTRMYIANFGATYNLYQFDLSHNWDISSAKPTKTKGYRASNSNRNAYNPTGMVFNPSGTELTFVDNSNDRLHTYQLSTPWEIDTMYNDAVWLDYSYDENLNWGYKMWDFVFNSDGTKMYTYCAYNSSPYYGIYEWDLSVPYMLYSAKSGGRVSTWRNTDKRYGYSDFYLDGTYITQANGSLFISPANDKLYINTGNSNYYGILQFALKSPSFDIESNTKVAGKLSASALDVPVADFGSLNVSGGLTVQSQLSSVDSGTANGSTVLSASYNYFRYTATGTYTISFSGLQTDKAWFATLELTNGGAYSVTWDSAIKWPGGVAPTLTSSGTDVIQFVSSDGGLNIRGILSIADSQ